MPTTDEMFEMFPRLYHRSGGVTEVMRKHAAQIERTRAESEQASANKAKRDAETRRVREAADTAAAKRRRQERTVARHEAARCNAILNSPHAQEDRTLAHALAYRTTMTSAQAIERLREHAAAKRARSWKRAMARAQNRPWDDAGEQPSSESSWDRAMRKVQGR